MLLPLKDINPTTRAPLVTVALIVINVAVFAYELTLGPGVSRFVAAWGATPFEIAHSVDLVGPVHGSPVYHAKGPPVVWLTLITAMFIHGGFLHIAGNMLFLWIFGDNIEDLLGPVKFILFYLLSGLAASATQIAANPSSTIPTVGASGAIAGVLGAYLIAYPHARVICLLFLFIFIRLIAVPAMLVIAFWFVIQAFQSVASISEHQQGGVAWFAHVGGFVTGVILIYAMASGEIRRLRAERRWGRNWYD